MTKWLLSVVVVAHVSLSLYEIDLNDEAERLKLCHLDFDIKL